MSISPSLKNNTISLDVGKYSKMEELIVTSGSIYPGMLVEVVSGGKVQPHGSAGLWAEGMFATENVYRGGTIEDIYPIGWRCMLRIFRRGDRILTKISGTVSFTIGFSMPLCSDGAGFLREYTPSTIPTDDHIVAISLEDDPIPSFPRWTAVRVV